MYRCSMASQRRLNIHIWPTIASTRGGQPMNESVFYHFLTSAVPDHRARADGGPECGPNRAY